MRISDWSSDVCSSDLGFSFQNSALYDSMTVRENLEFPLVRNKRYLTRKEINYAVERVLEAVDLSQAIRQMPAQLSGGQRRSEERRVGKECVSTCRSRWSPSN